MAVLALKSTQLDGATRKRPFDTMGKARYAYFSLPAVAVAGDIGSTVDLCDLPPGAVRILPFLSRLIVSAWGASRTLSIGHRAYVKADDTFTQEAESANAFVNALDVSGAVALSAWSATVMKYDVYSKAGVRIFGTVAGGTIPVGATMSGLVAYLYE